MKEFYLFILYTKQKASNTCILRLRSSKMVYSRVLENTAIGPGYNCILNAAQSRSIAAFFTKHNYKSQPIGGGKTQLQGDLQPHLKKKAIDPIRGYCRVVKASFVNTAIENAAIAYSYIFRVYSCIFETRLKPAFFVVLVVFFNTR